MGTQGKSRQEGDGPEESRGPWMGSARSVSRPTAEGLALPGSPALRLAGPPALCKQAFSQVLTALGTGSPLCRSVGEATCLGPRGNWRQGWDCTVSHRRPLSTQPLPALLHEAGRAPRETSICGRVSGVASGQLTFISLDTKTQRPSVCQALCPEAPSSEHTGGDQRPPLTWTSHSYRPNPWQVAQGPNQGGLEWLASATGGAVERRGCLHRGPSLPARRPPPEGHFPPLSRAHTCLALHT